MHANREGRDGRRRRVSWRRRVPGFLITLLSFCSLWPAPLSAAPSSEKEYFDIIKSIDLIGEVSRELSQSYVDTVNVSRLIYGGIDGMLRTLDPYTVFFNQEESKDFGELTSGQYAGIGITIATIEGSVFVTSVVDGYAAAKAGIRVGDSITAINKVAIKKKPLAEVKELIRGPLGATLTLTIERDGQTPFTVTLTRAEVRVSTVGYSGIMDGIGYIEMKSFGIRSADDVREAFQGLRKLAAEQQKPLRGLVFDLRNNPGGLLNVAVDVSSLFVKNGSEVVSIRGRSADSKRSYVTITPPVEPSLPLVVLINGQSASASEIVAGAVQDLDRGVIIGERSYGKGLVQSVVRLSYDNTLKLTTSKYYTPSGRLIQKEHVPIRDPRRVLAKPTTTSLTTVFYTKGKRKVYGGGGITPDIQFPDTLSTAYLGALQKQGLLFLFADSYRSLHPAMPPQPFDRQGVMRSFNEFLLKKKFTYHSDPERHVDELKKSMAKVSGGKLESSRQCLDGLQAEIERLRALEIARASDKVADALEVEILRHYNERIARKSEVAYDPMVKKALQVLSDSKQYSAILHP